MENDLSMSMLPTWHSPEILPPELNYSFASTGKSLPLADCFFKFNSAASSICSSSTVSPSRPAFHPPTNDNSLIKELIRNSTTGNFCSDPRFSGFRSQSFNGRTTRFHPNRSEFPNGVHQMWPKRTNFEREDRAEFSRSWEESSVSDPDKILGGEKSLILRKRKVAEVEDDSNPKRVKQIESNNEVEYETTVRGFNGGNALVEEETAKTAAPEPPKEDYIHVRARRGQATDSHSFAERVRREKIGERMRILQNLVPGCNKVTGKALMLDEIINYVQSLQRQVQFLSMKLATVNSVGSSSMFNMEVPKMNDVSTNRTAFLDSSLSASAFCGRNPKLFSPSALDGFSHPILPCDNMFGDDLHSIINTGFGACMKIEL